MLDYFEFQTSIIQFISNNMAKTGKILLSAGIWLLSFLIMGGIVFYQNLTGPTHPVKDKIEISGEQLSYVLPRSSDSRGDEIIKITAHSEQISGKLKYKRYKSNDEWSVTDMTRTGNELTVNIPHQPPAGKVIYQLTLNDGTKTYDLYKKPVVIRFRGEVPAWVIIPHILLMFLSVLFAVRTGFEAILKRKNTYIYTIITMLLFLIGGFVLGPMVQKYAFGVYWSGFPFGYDLTDNKVFLSLIFWVVAFFKLRKNKENTKWAVIAACVFLVIYLIPHSMLGSELKYTK